MITALLTAFGFYTALAQIFLLKEMASVFQSQEFSLSASLAAWLFWNAWGSARPLRDEPSDHTMARDTGLLALSIPITLILIRLSRLLLPAGESAGMAFTLLMPFLLLAIPCGLSGSLFARWVRRADTTRPGFSPGGHVYTLESLGALLGCVAATLLAGRAPMLILLAIGGAILSALTMAAFSVNRLSALLLVLAAALAAFSPALNRNTRSLERRPYPLIQERETPYQHLALVRVGNTQALLENGVFSGQFPDPAAREETALWPMLAHPNPERVAAFGVPAFLAEKEILSHPVTTLDFIDPDRRLFDLLPSKESARGVSLKTTDPRRWISSHPNQYDVILHAAPPPVTLALNRFYTEEFFARCRKALKPKGLLSFRLPSSENYLPPEVAAANASVLKAARAVFPAVELIPGASMSVLCSNTSIPLDPVTLLIRYKKRRLRYTSLTPSAFPFALHPERRNALERRLQEFARVPSNSDVRPLTSFLAWRVWILKFVSPAQMTGLWTAALLLGIGLSRTWKGRQRGNTLPLHVIVFTAGWTGMVTEISLLLLFQTASGALYYALGAMMAALMAGLWAGSGIVSRIPGAGAARALPAIAAILPLIALPLFLSGSIERLLNTPNPALLFGGLLFLNGAGLGAAYAVGAAAARENAGTLYASDLGGGALGAFSAGVLLIPLIGHAGTLALSGGLLLTAVLIFGRKFPLQTPRS